MKDGWKYLLKDHVVRNAHHEMIQETCDHSCVSFHRVMGRSKQQPYARIRQVCMWRLYRESNISMPVIGSIFNRDHTTVLHAIHKMDKEMESADIAENAKRT